MATIVLPDIPVKVMTLILHFCYNGQVVFPLELQKEIYDDMEYLMIGTGKELYIKKVITQPPSNSNLTLQANPAQALEKLEGTILITFMNFFLPFNYELAMTDKMEFIFILV